jgi:hypothetical protein
VFILGKCRPLRFVSPSKANVIKLEIPVSAKADHQHVTDSCV